jgi:hypothetical protein
LRWCAGLHQKVSSDQNWHEFSYFAALRFVLQFGVPAKFEDKTTDAAVKRTYEDRNDRDSVELPLEHEGFKTLFEAAAVTSANKSGKGKINGNEPTSPEVVVRYLKGLAGKINSIQEIHADI